ncbi:MAG: SRPBCC family protein [Candidatus Dormibacteraeota bacterium]|nr:SRPBCC family protein [Candidatus Dormibacteraeota bacterium]
MRGRPGPTWTIHVNVPREKAYAYVADLGRHGEWASQADEMTIKSDTPGPVAVGTTLTAEGTLLGKRNSSKVKVTALEPPERVEFEYEDSRGIGGHVFTFAPDGGGTLISRQIFGIKQPLLGPVFFRIFKRKIDVNYNGALSNLKTKLESGAT